jgi:hypothetical protein
MQDRPKWWFTQANNMEGNTMQKTEIFIRTAHQFITFRQSVRQISSCFKKTQEIQSSRPSLICISNTVTSLVNLLVLMPSNLRQCYTVDTVLSLAVCCSFQAVYTVAVLTKVSVFPGD